MTGLETLGNAAKFTAKLKSGLAAALPSAPDGLGDVYLATDTQVLYATTNGITWNLTYPMGGLANSNVRVKTTRGSNQTITQNTWTAVLWDQEEYDTNAMHSTSVNTDRLTCVIAGVYRITLNARWAVTLLGSHRCRIDRTLFGGGVTTVAECTSYEPSGGSAPALTVTHDITMAVGDYVQGLVRQEDSVSRALNLVGSAFSAQLIGT